MRHGRAGRSRPKPDGGRSRGAFSLMEVLLALVVIAIGLYGILDLVAANQRLSHRSLRQAQAVELAAGKMAEIRAAGFDAIEPLLPKTGDDASTYTLYPGAPAQFDPPYDSGPYLWQARFDRVGPEPGVVNVEVRVFWYPIAIAAVHDIRQNSVAVGALLTKK